MVTNLVLSTKFVVEPRKDKCFIIKKGSTTNLVERIAALSKITMYLY